MATIRYYVATAKISEDGPSTTFIVHPGVRLQEDPRTPDQIVNDAADKGFEVSYCCGMHQYSQHAEEVRRQAVVKMRAKGLEFRERDLDVELTNKIYVVKE